MRHATLIVSAACLTGGLLGPHAAAAPAAPATSQSASGQAATAQPGAGAVTSSTAASKAVVKGRLRVRLVGVPSGVRPRVVVKGPRRYRATIDASRKLKGLRPGRYRIQPAAVSKPGGTVTITRSRKVVRVRAGRTTRASVTYQWVPTKRVVRGLRLTNGAMGTYLPGQAVSWQLQATGGTPPYTFHDASAFSNLRPIPAWLSLSRSGRITGTVPSDEDGTTSFHVYVRQSDGKRSPYTGQGRLVTITVQRPTLPTGALKRLPPDYDGVIGEEPGRYFLRLWSQPDVVSYYLGRSGGLGIVAHREDNTLAIETLDPVSLQPAGPTRSISLAGWTRWGGLYAAPDGYFYVLVGRDNLEEDDDRGVVAVRRYDASWSLVGTAYVMGGASQGFKGIYQPFAASAADMTLVGDRLVVHMARLLYLHDDGLHHQVNFTFEVDVDTMSATPFGSFRPGGYAYASHSFAQFVAMNGRDLVMIDHGDAYPRAIQMGVMANYPTQRVVRTYDLFQFNGETGDNFTGTTVSGLISNDSGVVVVGTSIRHPNAPNGPLGSDSEDPNVYAIWADPTTGAHTFRWLTNWPATGDHWRLEPRVVPLSGNRYALLFSTLATEFGEWQTHYLLIGPTGNVQADASFPRLRFPSSTSPVLVNDRIYWADQGPSGYDNFDNHTYLYGLDVSNPANPTQLGLN